MKKNTKRRVLSAILAAVMTLSVGVTATAGGTASISASAADGYSDDFDYSYDFLNDGTIEISGYFGDDSDIFVPSEINGYTVSSIGYNAFYNRSVSSVIIPNTVTSIGNSAFGSCKFLESVTIPNSVTSIGAYAFKNCTLLESVTIPVGITIIGEYAFQSCSSLTNVTIPNGVTEIGESVFQDCTLLESVTIPNSVTTIGEYAFQSCYSLTSITIPSSVKSIGDFAFDFCASLENINVSSSNKNFSSINGVLMNKAKTELILCPQGKTGEYQIPDSVTEVALLAFNNCNGITSINVSGNNKGLSSKDGVLFNKAKTELILCPQGKTGEYEIPKTVTKIRDAAFFYCTSLTGITIPNSVKEIGIFAFAGCDAIVAVTIPNSVAEIKESTFASCSSLKFLVIPNSVKIIRKNAFNDCDNLKYILFIGKESEYNNILMNGEGNRDFLLAGVSYGTKKASSLTINKIPDQTYTGKAITPAVTVKDDCITLKNGTDYTVTYKNNTNIGTATVTITGKGNYSETKTATFKIVAPKVANPTNLKASQSANSVKLTWNKVSGATSYGVYVYDTKTGKYKGLATVTGTSYTAKNLKAGTTYKFAVRSNKKVGSKTFNSGNAVISTVTKPANVNSLKATQSTSSVKLSWSKAQGATSYDVYQKVSGKWKRVATTKSTSFTVKKLKAGTKYDFAVRANKVVGKTTYNGAFTFITTATKTATPTMTVKAGSKKATVTWKKVSGATGYEVFMSTKKTSGFKKVATVSASKTAKYTKTGLTKGKTYYFRVRTYKVVGKAKIYSGYQTKAVKIK